MSRGARFFWALFAGTMALYLVMVLWSLPHLQRLAGGLVPFDLRPMGYGPQEARALVAALGAEGADFYLNTQLWLDTAYPALMAAVLVLAYRRLTRGWMVWGAGSIAVLAAGFDYLENHGVAVMLRAGPDALSDAMAVSASGWTLWKSAASSLAFVVLLVLLLRTGWVWMRRN
ncbi:MAG: hypothetical protein WCC57_13500 [Paracoccaceae bacterium]